MAKRTIPKPKKIQIVCENVLKWCAFAITLVFLALGITYFLLPDMRDVLLRMEKWAVVAFGGMTIVYVLCNMMFAPQLLYRIKDFVKGLFRPELVLLLVFFVWGIISTFMADNLYSGNYFSYNDRGLFRTFTAAAVIFPLAYMFRGKNSGKMLEIIIHIFCSVLTLLMVYIIYKLCRREYIVLPGGADVWMTSGYRLNINCNSNTTGAIAELIMMMCLYIAVSKKGVLRYLYAVATLVHYIILVLSNSRTCILATGIAVGAIVGKLCFDALKNRPMWQKILIAVAAAAATAVMILELRKLVFNVYFAITHVSKSGAEVARGADSTFSGRVGIWIASLKSIFQDARHFFFGVTPVNVTDEVAYWTVNHLDMYTHNQFLEIAVAHGIPGLAIYLAWLVLIARSCLRIVAKKTEGIDKGWIVVIGMILMLVLANLMEATLLYYQFTFISGMFFLLCGMITYRATK